MKVKWMGGARKNQFQPLKKTRKTKIWVFPDFLHVFVVHENFENAAFDTNWYHRAL